MSFFLNKLTTHLSVPGAIHANFNSVSSPIYEKKSKNDRNSLFFESLMFAFLELIYRKKDLKKFKSFSILFEDSLEYLKENYFTSIKEVTNITNYDNFKEMKEELLHYLRSYEILIFRKKEGEFTKDDFAKSRKKSQYRFHMILKLMLMSEIMQLIEYEKSKEKKCELERFLKDIIAESFEENHYLMNMLVATIFQLNIKIYNYSDPSRDDVEFYKVQKQNNDFMDRLNLMKDKAGYYRLLSDCTARCAKENEEIYEKFEIEKEELTKKMKSYLAHQKNLVKEIQILKRLYEHSKNMAVEIVDGCKNYIDILTGDKSNKNNSLKFSTRKKFRESFRKIKSYERIMRKRNLPHINSDKLLMNIVNKLESMKHSLEENQDRMTEATDPEDNKDFEDEDRLSLKLDRTPKNKSNVAPQFFPINPILQSEFDVGVIVLKQETLIECLICTEKKMVDDIRTFDCDCKLCTDCLHDYLKSRYDAAQYDLDIPCFNSACQSKKPGVFPPVSLHLVREMLGQEALEKMQDFLVYKIADRKCANPQCNFRFQLSTEEAQKDFFMCAYCQHQTCLKCWNLRHIGKQCARIDESLKNAYEGVMVRLCPNPKCLNPATKDRHCDQVTCVKCALKFCFPCSFAQAPISAHGNHYHRKDCKNFHPWINPAGQEMLVDEFDKRCTECIRLGKVCPRPELTTKDFYESKKVDQFFIDSLENNRDDDDNF